MVFLVVSLFLIGAACLGFLPAAGTRTVGVEAWLVVLPLLYLVHFFYGLSIGRRPGAATVSDGAAPQPGLPVAAKAFIGVVVGLGVAVLAYAVAQWTSADPVRFAGFAALAVVAATWKVRLPGMVGTISLGFVVVLVSIVELSWRKRRCCVWRWARCNPCGKRHGGRPSPSGV